MTSPAQKGSNSPCRICTNAAGNRLHQLREMMFDSDEAFDYSECSSCGTLQITSVPNALDCYYPKSYAVHHRRSGIRSYLSKRAALYQWKGFGPLGWAYTIFSGRLIAIDAIKVIAARKAQSLLDVGCGSGDLLRLLHYLGFRTLMGTDPFIGEESLQKEPFPIVKGTLKDVSGTFDLVVLNHVFEHMPDPGETMEEIEKHLSPNGTALIFIPVAGCAAWNEYKTNWIQLDAPRHLFLHTPAGIKLLCQKSGLIVENILWNSTEFQFVGSDQCRNGISLISPKSIYAGGIKNRIKLFIARAKLKSRVSELNKCGLGDQACFIIKKR